tara:strand:- start:752 stop:1672 length:921 start_codon:yes stop_codon:yes gene_type:complete
MDAYKFPDETTPIVQEEIEVDIVDDVPEGDRNREALTDNPEPDENELASYSDRVKKRIGILQRAFHDERRAKEQSSRERDEAMSYANNIVAKNKSLVQKSNDDASLLHETWKSKAESDLDSAKKSYKSAYESGDADAVVDAQEALNRATMRHENSILYKPTLQTQEIPVEPENSVRTAPPPDDAAVSWASKNSWFGKDRLMTGMAYGLHEELISSGVHPQRDAKKYYGEINQQMRKRFPDYGWDDSEGKEPRQRTSANIVAPVTRTSSGGKKVSLTQTQVAIAKRLNIPLAEYAKQVSVLEGMNNG